VSIFWSVDGGKTWPFVLAYGQGNDSSWTWAVGSEDTCSSQSRVAVHAYDGLRDCSYDISDADFWAGGPEEGQWEPALPRSRTSAKPTCYADADATIFFHLPTAAVVNLSIYDVQGRLVRSLIDGQKLEGTHRARWDLKGEDGTRVSRGIHFYRFTAGSFTDTGKIVVVE
jgi:FlgD Ig-like domain